MAYVIKNNLPTETDGYRSDTLKSAKDAKESFLEIVDLLSEKYPTKVFFRSRPLRGRIQVEIDGFFYYVELFKV